MTASSDPASAPTSAPEQESAPVPTSAENNITNKRRRSNWVTSNANIYYRPRLNKKPSLSADRFPSPLIGPRRSRPQAIHIVSYPSGYIPKELRPQREQSHRDERKDSQPPKSPKKKKASSKDQERAKDRRKNTARATDTASRRRSESNKTRDSDDGFPLLRPPVLTKFLASFSSNSIADSSASTTNPAIIPVAATAATALPHQDLASAAQAQTQWSRVPSPPAYDVIRPGSAAHNSNSLTTRTSCSSSPPSSTRTPNHRSIDSSFTMAARVSIPPAQSAYNVSNRNSLMSVRSAKSAVTSLVTEVPKPVASGSGVTCSILLAEPNIFLSGFDHDGHGHREGQSGTALLRGKLQLRISKNIKIKAVQLKLLGRARTEWPEGIPPLKQDLFEEESLRTQVLTFFNAMNDGWESEYGNQCTYKLKNTSPNGSSTNLAAPSNSPHLLSPHPRNNMTAKEMKRLSLQNVQSRSFNKDSPIVTPTQAKGYKVFYPGVYDYSFELPIDHHQLETTKLQYGSVRWELHATVDRAGAFKPNLHGMKEVSIVRVPDQMSLEMTEPISISRQWEDQLHYDIIISGKSFPIGSKIPIAFKLTPLAKVQVHKLKVFVTESIEYWTNDKRVTRKDPGRKILLLEKSAGKQLDPSWASSELRTLRGGELNAEQRREARQTAARRRTAEASRSQTVVQPLPEPTDNLLGDLDLGLESFWGSTEIEANVQIPTCEMMAKNKELRLHPDCSWKNVNVYHWIKVVMRISRLDPEDPTGKKRRHFEISIDSPFTVLNCRATHANTNLPAYSGSMCQGTTYQSACGCPDAFTIPTEVSPSSSTGTLAGVNADLSNENLPAPPQAAHLANGPQTPRSSVDTTTSQNQGPRPIHLLRVPSFNPPAFEDDIAPPPAPELVSEAPGAMTPPPHYDTVVGTPSVDGMADYFARLADYGFDGPEEDSSSEGDETPPRILDRNGRVNVAHPRTPGGRMPSRSFEISRPPIELNMDTIRRRAAGAV
ncbi:Fc.00g002110.m01.CDS01 [Cosmosporella sp. VM-42]